jgi:hypothetical protein
LVTIPRCRVRIPLRAPRTIDRREVAKLGPKAVEEKYFAARLGHLDLELEDLRAEFGHVRVQLIDFFTLLHVRLTETSMGFVQLSQFFSEVPHVRFPP